MRELQYDPNPPVIDTFGPFDSSLALKILDYLEAGCWRTTDIDRFDLKREIISDKELYIFMNPENRTAKMYLKGIVPSSIGAKLGITGTFKNLIEYVLKDEQDLRKSLISGQ